MADFDNKARQVQDQVKNTPGLGKSMAKWGALGAVVAVPIPFVGPLLGAAAGAGYAYFKATKKG
ncbi:hypothetical protein [uncultured Sphingomonas sp.]|uniref:hypothetical protein n=1 Tax=uncultured Sphingomonas sp. TaxID=158754 RepID=UPI002610545B|nr:hypothetical protein [uncultured Sphingomonas sp.]